MLSLTIQRTGDFGNYGDRNGNNFYKFFLQSESLIIQHNRTPIVSSLPGTDPILLDLGQWTVDIKIEGVADVPVQMGNNRHREKLMPNPDSGDGERAGMIPVADKDDLEGMADPTVENPWHIEDILIRDRTYSYGDKKYTEYQVKIQSVTVSKSNVNDFYTFMLSASGYLGQHAPTE